MLETPKIVQSSPELSVFIHLIVPRSEIRVVMAPGTTIFVDGDYAVR